VDAFAAHQQKDANTANIHIAAAKDNFNKARHDVVDASLTFYADNAGRIREQIGAGEALKRFPKYLELFSLIKTMQKQKENSREDRNQRDAIYQKLLEDLPKLETLYNEFDACHTAISDQLKQEKLKTIGSMTITIFSLLISLVTCGFLIFLN